MSVYFISDLHLSAAQPHLTEKFDHFIQMMLRDADALYILGDFFDVWLGDDDPSPYANHIKDYLRNLSENNIPVYLQRGNRDFMLSEQFAKACQATLLPDWQVIDLYGIPTLITHGDQLCTADYQYQRYRKWVQHPWTKKCFQLLPLTTRKWIAQRIRNASQAHFPQEYDPNKDAQRPAIIHALNAHKVNILIHGHTHRPSIHWLKTNTQWQQRIVLSDWGKKGNYLKCNKDGNKSLMYF